MSFFDTHAHLDNEQIFSDVESRVQQAIDADVIGITAIGTTVSSSQQCVRLAGQFASVYAAVGIHPNECKNSNDADWQQIVELARQEKVVAIGETGLDRHWDDCPFDIQETWFSRHIKLSFATGLPLVIHMRDCESDILRMLEQHLQGGKIIGIMHSFAGSLAAALQCLEWGMYISFSGMVTFKKSDELRAVASQIPDDRLLIETDAPYLTPHPQRGKRPNHPAMVCHTAQCLADVKDISLEKLGQLTTRNAQQVFGLL